MTNYERLRKLCVGLAWLYFFFTAYMLLHPKPPTPLVPPPLFNVVHFLAFGALGGLVGLARKRTSAWYWFGILFIWCSGSEYLQNFTGRKFEIIDIVQNTLGVATGLLVAAPVRLLLERCGRNIGGGAIAVLARPPYELRVGKPFDLENLEVLVIRRSSTVAAPGALCFPGGHIERGESASDAARREFKEEVGLDVTICEEIARNRTPSGKPLTWFLASAPDLDENAISLQRAEVDAVEWRTLPSLVADPQFLDNNRAIVRRFVECGVIEALGNVE